MKIVTNSAVMQKSGVEKGFDSFLKEARKMAKLRSIPSVVGVNSVFIQNETAYIVMDFIEGETLLTVINADANPFTFNLNASGAKEDLLTGETMELGGLTLPGFTSAVFKL